MLVFRSLCFLIASLIIDSATADGVVEFFDTDSTTTTTSFPTTPPIPTLPPDYIYHPDIKTAYKLHNDELSWNKAVDSCRTEGARLAVIDTWNKVQYVIGMRTWRDFVWTGIFRDSRGSEWKAVDGVPLPSVLPWSFMSYQIFGECVAVHGWVHGLSSWSCEREHKYVCEIPDEE